MAVYCVGIIQFDDLIDPNTGTPFDFTAKSTSGCAFEIRRTAKPVMLPIDDGAAELDDAGAATTGRRQRLSAPVAINGTTFGPVNPGATPTDQVAFEFGFCTRDAQSFYVVCIDGVRVGLTAAMLPQPGQVIEIKPGVAGQAEP